MNLLDGKKALIGTILIALSVWLPQFGAEGDWIVWLAYIGTALGGVGFAHKGMKGQLTSRKK